MVLARITVGAPFVLSGGLVGGEDLEDVVAAAVQLPDFVVGPSATSALSSGVLKKHSPDVGAVLGLEGLVLAVDAVPSCAS